LNRIVPAPGRWAARALTTLQVAGMPMGKFAIQPGQHSTGHTP